MKCEVNPEHLTKHRQWNHHKSTVTEHSFLKGFSMSVSYLDESDTDEEGAKVTKCYSEIEISEAQLKCSNLKGRLLSL